MRFIENDDALCAHGNREARKELLAIADAAIEGVQPERLISTRLTRDGSRLCIGDIEYDLDDVEDVIVIGVGKGSAAVVAAVLGVLDGRVDDGLVVEKHGQGTPIDGATLPVLEAGHPIPDTASRTAADRVGELADRAGPEDLVCWCITGGASALLAAPAGELTLAELATTTERLLDAGVPIQALNTVRKHLSTIKGGRLATRCAPATTVSLIVVDEVAGDPWGPTVPDETTYADALGVLKRYELTETVPTAVVEHLNDGRTGRYTETPDDAEFGTLPARSVVLADGTTVCGAAQEAAEDHGYTAMVLSTTIEGEASTVGTVHGGIAREIATHSRPIEPPCVVISGGETTVTVDGDGAGGPNQEFALGLARSIDGLESVTGLGIDTDGTDGPTPVAGGLVDGQTVERAADHGIDLLAALGENDAMGALAELGDAIRTVPTGTNLMDLRLVLVEA